MPALSDYELFEAKAYLNERDYCTKVSNMNRQPFFLPTMRAVTDHLMAQATSTSSPAPAAPRLLIDVGSGPTIHMVMSLSALYDRIIVSDYLPGNRREVERWLTREKGAHSWDAILDHCAQLEATPAKKLEDRLRRRIVAVKPCNVLEPAVLPNWTEKADTVLSSLALEAACKSLNEYRIAMRNLAGLIKPGGHLILAGVLGGYYYQVGERYFHSLPLTLAEIRQTVEDSDLVIQKIEKQQGMDESSTETDSAAAFVLLAQKILED